MAYIEELIETANLTQRQERTIIDHFLGLQSIKDIAEAAGVTRQAVSLQLHAALKKLRRKHR